MKVKKRKNSKVWEGEMKGVMGEESRKKNASKKIRYVEELDRSKEAAKRN